MAEFAKIFKKLRLERELSQSSLAYQRALSICMNAETAAPISRRRK